MIGAPLGLRNYLRLACEALTDAVMYGAVLYGSLYSAATFDMMMRSLS